MLVPSCWQQLGSANATRLPAAQEAAVSQSLIILTGFIYLYVAAEQMSKGNWPMATTYAAYSLANAGLFFAVK